MNDPQSQETDELRRRLRVANDRYRELARQKHALEERLGGGRVSDARTDETELLALRSQVRDLTLDLNRALYYLSTIREHVEGLFASRRWQVGGMIGDTYLRLRRRERPPTAENHIRELYRDIDRWEAQRRSSRGVSQPATGQEVAHTHRIEILPPEEERGGTLFYRSLEEIAGSADDTLLAGAIERSESLLASLQGPVMDDGAPLVTVVMPTYNRRHVLDQAIRSVREQTYDRWELIVSDDGSTDGTESFVTEIDDPRVRYIHHSNTGAAAARNRALEEANGELIAYLDSDNLWHPSYLAVMVAHLQEHSGRLCVYCRHVDVELEDGGFLVRRHPHRDFDFEALAEKNFVDLNAFVHRRELYEALGGFDERLRRQQDWDLVLKYSSLRDPSFVDALLVLYRRHPEWGQITVVEHDNRESAELVRGNLEERLSHGMTIHIRSPTPSVSILSWDICRNHFSKAYNLAEALSKDRDVELVGFRFFESEIFPPYAGETPPFETRYFPGSDFPEFAETLNRALTSLRGDVVYAVKPRLPSLGLALLANFHFAKPVVLEINDLESVVAEPRAGTVLPDAGAIDVRPTDPRLLDPHGQSWSLVLEEIARDLPVLVTHNGNLDRHFGEKSYQLRNIKDEEAYDPDRIDRGSVRRRLGLAPDAFVLLFGGMVRRHKGVFSLARFVENLDDDRVVLLVVSSRPNPDEKELARAAGDRMRILPAQGRNAMAEINAAADATVLWLDPDVPASHFQMPFKLTDAMAVGLPVIANPISDLGHLGQQGYLRLVDYDDFEGLARAIESLRAAPEETRRMTERARRLFLRQFSYSAARASLELILRRVADDRRCLPAASRFEALFSTFYETLGRSVGGPR